jgi:hypothetical protein
MYTDLVRYTDLDGTEAQKFLQKQYAAMDRPIAKSQLKKQYAELMPLLPT